MTAFAVARELPSGRTGHSAEPLTLADLPALFHRLNNQLGVILANAELLETRLTTEPERARASQVVAGALEAIASVQHLRRVVGAAPERPLDSLNPSAK
jgi:hypothetical protein